MNIAFDAKRAYHNTTGLGHYSRTLIRQLATQFPGNEYFLFNPKPSKLFGFNGKNLHEVLPTRLFSKMFTSAWRSSWVRNDLKKLGIELYHGLSHEIPIGISKSGIKAVVTIHDLIHERYPQQYSAIDVKIYSRKFRYACENADRVIAISEQTKNDIMQFYKTPEEKISVCYQSCSPAFSGEISEEKKEKIRKKYKLPGKFFLYVGSVIERKNLLNVCKAVFLLRKEVDIPLVVIGQGGKYMEKVKDFIRQQHLEEKIILLSEKEEANDIEFITGKDLPAIYRSAVCLLYPSFFEGFGIPVVEALWSRLPVITSNVSCLPEAGGDAAYYVNPNSAEEIAEGMKTVLHDKKLRELMIEKGLAHAIKFSPDKCAARVMEVYNMA